MCTITVLVLGFAALSGVMPGVTVDASNPAMIEKVRTGTTTARGKIVDLRPRT
jgi:hypothetical protein